jgi:hypothetical protein
MNVDARPTAIIVDIDGTVSLRGERDPYDLSRVWEDTPNWPVIHVVESLYRQEAIMPLFVSGRSDKARPDTLLWLKRYMQVPVEHLWMRVHGDGREDQVVKHEIYINHIEPNWKVMAVFDDRDKVVRMWRDTLGLPCFQVNYGDF